MSVSQHTIARRSWQRLVGAHPARELAVGWIWAAVVVGWPSIVLVVHVVSEAILGPLALPFTPARFLWTLLADAVLLGVLISARIALRRGAAVDLLALQPILPASLRGGDSLAKEIDDVAPPLRVLGTCVGLGGGLAMATLDPVLRGLYDHASAFDPRYLLFVLQIMLFGALGARLFMTEVHMTRAYARLGERVELDLLDHAAVLVFGRKGLRSVAVWVLVSSAVSMFWVLDAAGSANVGLPFVLLGIATAALVAPSLGVRRNLARVKARELDVVTRAIRGERHTLLGEGGSEEPGRAGHLADLIAYESYVRGIREWPFDLSIVSRSLLFVVLGCGSWLGAALVERLLGLLLD